MRILINVKETGGKIGIEAKLDTGCRDTARERAAGEVAERYGRNSILIELNPAYVELQKQRTAHLGLFFL